MITHASPRHDSVDRAGACWYPVAVWGLCEVLLGLFDLRLALSVALSMLLSILIDRNLCFGSVAQESSRA